MSLFRKRKMWSPFKAWELMFKRRVSFVGRSTRGEFFYATLMMFGLLIGYFFIVENFRIRDEFILLVLLYSLVIFSFTLIIPTQVRRLHDLNMSGYWVWIFIIMNLITNNNPDLFFVDILNIGLHIVLMLIPSQHKTNRFGSDPTADINGFYQYYSRRKHVLYGAYGLTTNHISVSNSFSEEYNSDLAGSQLFKHNMQQPKQFSINSDLAGSRLFQQTMQQPKQFSVNSDLAGSKLFKQTMHNRTDKSNL